MVDKITVQDSVTVGALPGSPNGIIKPKPGQVLRITADPRKEYVSGGGLQWLTNYVRTLSFAIDDVTSDFGSDLYDRMQLDEGILAPVNTLKAGVLENSAEFSAAITDEEDPNYQKSKDIADFCTRVMADLPVSFDAVLWNLLDAMPTGNKIAELVFADDATYTGKTQSVLRSIKVKPRHSAAFVVDAFDNVLGLLALIPGVGLPVQVGTTLQDLNHVPNLLPRDKFAVLTHQPKDGDPRGTSILRAAYSPWWESQQLAGEFLRYLTQYAGPSLVGTTAPEAQGEIQMDTDGGVLLDPMSGLPISITPEQAMLNQLTAFRNGTVIVLPNGATVEPLHVPGNGEAFLSAFDRLDRRKTRAILYQTLATMEAEHGTRAQAGVHQDTLTTIKRQIKNALARVIRREILWPLIRPNFGDDARTLVPLVSLGETEQKDYAGDATATAALFTSGFISDDQLPGIDTMLGLPARDMEALAVQRQQEQEQATQQAQMQLEAHKATLAAVGANNDDGDKGANGAQKPSQGVTGDDKAAHGQEGQQPAA